MKRFVLLPLLLLPAAAAQAGTIHRCVGADRQVSYQAAQCPPGQRLDRTIAFEPESAPAPVAESSRSNAKPRSARRSGYAGGGARHAKRQPTASDRCHAAREQREAALRKLGLKRTYEDLGRLDAPVRAACRW